MREIRTSGSMSGDWNRSLGYRARLRLYSTPSSSTSSTARGWVCVTLVVFASWWLGKALLGAQLFAFSMHCSCACSTPVAACWGSSCPASCT